MKFQNFFLSLFIILSLISCAEKEEKVSLIKEKVLEMQMIEAYNEGLKEFNRGDIFFAAKKFNEVELLYPQSSWAPRSTLMAAYVYYSQLYFNEAIIELERFLDKYKNHKNTDYAYYLLAITYYELIVDETKDLKSILKSKEYFQFIIENYPNTDYAMDSRFKLELINEVLASKEMYLARYYLKKEKWIPAINRFKEVVENYNDTIYIEEALHRLVEIHYKLGIEDEAKKYAYLLGYNYQSSEWYEKSYKIFNKKYMTNNELKKEKEGIFKKFKRLLK